jgi:hypothetical protein
MLPSCAPCALYQMAAMSATTRTETPWTSTMLHLQTCQTLPTWTWALATRRLSAPRWLLRPSLSMSARALLVVAAVLALQKIHERAFNVRPRLAPSRRRYLIASTLHREQTTGNADVRNPTPNPTPNLNPNPNPNISGGGSSPMVHSPIVHSRHSRHE